ncbi:hypothetical protein AN959_01225 [Psychrobacillus sp. FJAT-21963]|nr:hypothetical protein AN959_01225 [Psychrobacillus sp. FJAT-21963]
MRKKPSLVFGRVYGSTSIILIGAEAATPAGKAGQSRPWTELCEGSGSAPPAESVRQERNFYHYFN